MLVRATVAHEDYDIFDFEIGLYENHDIALLFLDEALTTPIAYLPSSSEAVQIEEGLTVEIVGWGQPEPTDGWHPPPKDTYAMKQMGSSFIARLAAYEMQIGLEEADVRKCHGDSGGPTFLHIETTTDDSMRLIGVTSHSYDQSDCERTGGVDTRVDYYLDWIDAADARRVRGRHAGLVRGARDPRPADDRSAGGHGRRVRRRRRGREKGVRMRSAAASPLPAILAGLLALRRKRGNPRGP